MKVKYEIYQADVNCDYVFDWWELCRDKFNFKKDYKSVYKGELEVEQDEGINDILEDLFVKFNANHPADYEGRSLSVSDVIKLDFSTDELLMEPQYFFCDCNGWEVVRVGE